MTLGQGNLPFSYKNFYTESAKSGVFELIE
jgi:hypothetical protein